MKTALIGCIFLWTGFIGCGGIESADSTAPVQETSAGLVACNTGEPGIPGGKDVDGKILFYCIARHPDGSLQPGKHPQGSNLCYYPYGGRELATTNYYLPGAGAGRGHVIAPLWRATEAVSPQPGTGCRNISIISGRDTDGSNLFACSGYVGDLYGFGRSPYHTPGKWSGTTLGQTCDVSFAGQEWGTAPTAGNEPEVIITFPANDNCVPNTLRIAGIPFSADLCQ